MNKTQLEIELEIINQRIDSLETSMKWLTSNWVDWTSRTKEMGQRLIIALEEKVNVEEDNDGTSNRSDQSSGLVDIKDA